LVNQDDVHIEARRAQSRGLGSRDNESPGGFLVWGGWSSTHLGDGIKIVLGKIQLMGGGFRVNSILGQNDGCHHSVIHLSCVQLVHHFQLAPTSLYLQYSVYSSANGVMTVINSQFV
jgi:hypothetical protein